jgi:hypothetical protein
MQKPAWTGLAFLYTSYRSPQSVTPLIIYGYLVTRCCTAPLCGNSQAQMLTLFNHNLYDMKRLNLILLFIISLCMVITISCKKEKDPDVTQILTGKWDMLLQTKTIADINLVEFKPSGVVTIEKSPADGIPELIGTWEAQGTHVIIRLAIAGNAERFRIEGDLSNEALTIKGTFRDTDPGNPDNNGTASLSKKQ